MTTIFLARHGETDWNRAKRWQGHADPSLNDRGREQASALAEKLEAVRFSAIYSSDLQRAYETARIVAERKKLLVTAMRELREIDVGSWTELSHEEVKERFLDAYTHWRTRTGRGWEGGESYAEMGRRVLEALRSIARKHLSEEVLVVTHSGPIRTVHAHAIGLDFATNRRAGPSVELVGLSAVTVVEGVFRPANAGIDQRLAVNCNPPSTFHQPHGASPGS